MEMKGVGCYYAVLQSI
uniref:Uncharacterized protein n=1 Tax=Arundo donax TaxID=35708 RepID=A0A0A9G3Y3_ARUDO